MAYIPATAPPMIVGRFVCGAAVDSGSSVADVRTVACGVTVPPPLSSSSSVFPAEIKPQTAQLITAYVT